MSHRWVRRRLAPTAGLLIALGLAVSPVGPVMAAHASTVNTGDVVFEEGLSAGGSALAIRAASGGAVTELTALSPYTSNADPDVSPDGSKILYADKVLEYRDSAYHGGPGIWVMNSDGTGQTQLTFPDQESSNTADKFRDSLPRWSHDGTKILFVRESYPSYSDHLYSMNADGTGVTDLTPSGTGGVNGASWSPNDDKIVYVRHAGTYPELAVMDSNGDNEHAITASNTCTSSPAIPDWSPDGSRIYYWGYCSPTKLLYVTSTDGFATAANSTEHVLQGTISTSGYHLRVSDDGAYVYFDTSAGNLSKVDTSSGTVSALTTSGYFYNSPDPVDATWPNGSTKTIVALGDSVAAGEGINYGFTWNGSGWDQKGPNTPTWMDTIPALDSDYQVCHQSGHGYPNLVSTNGGNYQVYNMACTGASSPDGILGGYTVNGASVPAELGWGGSSGGCTGCSSASTVFDGHNPDTVLLTVGANDIDFRGWMRTCYSDTAHCDSSTHTSTRNGQLSAEAANLRLVLTELNRWAGTKSKTLKVYVTNYYEPFSTSHTGCIDVNNDGHFPGINVSGSGNALSWLMSGLSSLNSNISSEVTYAQTNDGNLSVHLVDLSGVMSGHEFCTDHPWIYGPSIDYPSWEDWNGSENPTPFHPTPDGQHAIEGAVSAALSS